MTSKLRQTSLKFELMWLSKSKPRVAGEEKYQELEVIERTDNRTATWENRTIRIFIVFIEENDEWDGILMKRRNMRYM